MAENEIDRSELENLIKQFVKECGEKNYHGIAVAMPLDQQKSQIGISTDYMGAVKLLRGVLQKLQEVTGISSIMLANHLALSLAILEIDASRDAPIEKLDSEILEKAANMVRSQIDIQLAKTRLAEARLNFKPTILH